MRATPPTSGTKLNANLVIMEKKMIIKQLIPPIMAIVIENKSIVAMPHEQFEIIWKSVGGKIQKEKSVAECSATPIN